MQFENGLFQYFLMKKFLRDPKVFSALVGLLVSVSACFTGYNLSLDIVADPLMDELEVSLSLLFRRLEIHNPSVATTNN